MEPPSRNAFEEAGRCTKDAGHPQAGAAHELSWNETQQQSFSVEIFIFLYLLKRDHLRDKNKNKTKTKTNESRSSTVTMKQRGRARGSAGGNTIEVSVRVRPDLSATGAGLRHEVPPSVQAFKYPSTVILGSDQNACFEAVGAPLLRRMRQGYNTTLLAYGQTGSGKTYTMFGPTGSLTEVSLGGKRAWRTGA